MLSPSKTRDLQANVPKCSARRPAERLVAVESPVCGRFLTATGQDVLASTDNA